MLNLIYIKKEIKIYLTSKGFKKSKGNLYYRVRNDVRQYIDFDFVVSQWCYRIYFDILPFCAGDYPINYRSITIIEGIQNEDIDLAYKEELILQDILYRINKYLFPFFDECNDSISSYRKICEVEDLYYGKDKPNYAYENMSNFWLAVKSQDFDMAKKVVDSYVQQNTYAFEINMKHNPSQNYIDKHNQKMLKWAFYLNLLKPENTEKLNELIENNETLVREKLKLK